MKIGFVSRVGEFPETEWEEEFRIAEKNKLDHLELIVNYPFFGPQTYTQQQVDKLKSLAGENNLKLILHLLPNQYQLPKGIRHTDAPKKFQEHEKFLKKKIFNIASENEKVREFSIEEIKKILNMAQKLEANLVVIHGGSFTEDTYKVSLETARKSLEELNSYSGTVKLAVENLPTLGHFTSPPNELPIYAKDLIYLVTGLNNIGICFDIGHANTLRNPIEFYDEINKSGKIWDMHVHDNNGDKDDHLALGRGNIDFKKFLKKLRVDNYSGYFSIELDTWNETPEPMKTKERIEALGYLKRLT